MSAWTRSVTLVALATALLAAAPASAQTPAEQAETLNQEGKRLFAGKDYDRAYGKFREAATLSPEGRFFFNMCYALNFLERYQDAIQACEQVEAAGADAELIGKTRKALASLRDKAAAQDGARGGDGAVEPAAGEPTGEPTSETAGPSTGQETARVDPVAGTRRESGRGGPPAPGPGGPDPFIAARAAAPTGGYKWSVGGSIGVLGNVNTGRASDGEGGDSDIYGSGGADFRLFASFIVSERARLGLQGSLGFGALAPKDQDVDDNLVIADIGAAIFLHLPLGRHLVVTPLVGPLVSVQQPQELSQGFIAGGGRAELGISYVFGRAGEHVISVVPAYNVYGPASGEEDGLEPIDFGLDEAHATFGVSLGYAYRFSSPFGSAPLITLE
ncbi:MAG TPA: hypothetical protein VK698_31145 [Kofleriaceae bacterium]|nr:hypothetical protein [Kofleriaceae bacterium]